MDYDLTDTQKEIVELAYQIAMQKVKPVREHYDTTEEFPWPVLEEIRKADLFGVYIPQAYGGLGGGTLDLVLVAEQISRACAGIALAVAASALCGIPILLFGNAKQREKWLTELASGKKLGAFTITEPGAGSDATATRCTARLVGDHYVLNGTKNFCSSGNAAELYTVFASTNLARGARGITAFVVEKGTPGFSFGKKEHKMGIRASPTYDLDFKDCKIPKDNDI
jgi:butyryl-CoA dehydrogenase